jgi:hypothetical protein
MNWERTYHYEDKAGPGKYESEQDDTVWVLKLIMTNLFSAALKAY